MQGDIVEHKLRDNLENFMKKKLVNLFNSYIRLNRYATTCVLIFAHYRPDVTLWPNSENVFVKGKNVKLSLCLTN
jgi:hypothetical protein